MMQKDATLPRASVLAALVVVSILAGCNQIFDLEETELAKTNFYTCSCDCSRRVVAPTGGSLFTSPGGLFLDTVLIGAEGAIVDGPEDGDVNGQLVPFWQVSFNGLPVGWIVEAALTVANETLVTKSPNVCLPAKFNPYLGGTDTPLFTDLQGLCRAEVADAAQVAIDDLLTPLGKFFCQCDAKTVDLTTTKYDKSCTKACSGSDQVCLVAGFDPPVPTPARLVDEILQPVSECAVGDAAGTGVIGEVQITAGGHAPKTQPNARGAMQIRGRPCAAGAGCLVAISYQLTSDDVEFDSGSIFADDPKFVDIGLVGATEPDAINMGPFLGFHLGEVSADSAFSSIRGRRSGESDAFALSGSNTEGLALAVNWPSKVCRIAGELVGQAVGDGDEGTLDAQVNVALDGIIVNQPPIPRAGDDQTVECTGPSGATVTLDASASTDADGNISFYEWRRGSQTGTQLAAPSASPSVTVTQALGQQTYHVLVADSAFAADRDLVDVSVSDTIAPSIDCNAPATITPSDAPGKGSLGLSFTATASDACTGVSSLAITGVTCTRPTSCHAQFSGATLTITESGGVGNLISWTLQARDGDGNPSEKTCVLRVVRTQ